MRLRNRGVVTFSIGFWCFSTVPIAFVHQYTLHTVDGKNFAKILTQNFWTSFAQIFGIRCLPGDTRTFSQASRRFLAYVFQGILTFKRKNLPEKFRKIQKNHKITYFFYVFIFSFYWQNIFLQPM